MCEEAFQDQLPNRNKEKLIDSKLQLPPLQKLNGVKFPRRLPIVTFSFQIMWTTVTLVNIFLTKAEEEQWDCVLVPQLL